LIVIAVLCSFTLHVVDAISTYLTGSLDKEIYIELPEGYDSKGMVYRLLKNLYRLKQSARIWNHKPQGHLVANGFMQLYLDYRLYFNEVVLVAVYIDDIPMARPKNLKAINEVKKMLSLEFNIKDLGKCQQLLDMKVMQTSGEITIWQ
jgi:hypothetical protein